MSKLTREIEKYVSSKQSIWSNRTGPVVRSTLTTLASDFSNPDENYKKLIGSGKAKYTIKQYFVIAGKFEEEVFGTSTYKAWIKRNRSTFRNCYKEKTKNLKREEFEKFKAMYAETNHNMFNLLVLMGEAGLRVSEALNAKWEDLKDGFLWVDGKGNKRRPIPFSPSRLLGEGSDKIVGTVAYRFFFKRDMRPYTPHDFRAHYATMIATTYANEISVKDLSKLLGHESIVTTEKYMRSDINRIAKVLNR